MIYNVTLFFRQPDERSVIRNASLNEFNSILDNLFFLSFLPSVLLSLAVYARSPSPSQRPAPTTIASRSPFTLGLCSCSTSLSKMGRLAAPSGRGALEEMGTYPRHVLYFLNDIFYMMYTNTSLLIIYVVIFIYMFPPIL